VPHCRFASANARPERAEASSIMESLRHNRSGALTAAGAEQEPKDGEGEEGPGGIDKGIVRRGLAAGDERLMDLIESGVAEGDEQRGQSPGPAPADAATANATVEEQTEDEVFGEVSGLADVMVDELELSGGEVGFEPAEEGLEERGGVLRREGVHGHGEDESGPKESGPPDAQPCGDQQARETWLHLREMRSGARIAPGLIRHAGSFRQERLNRGEYCRTYSSRCAFCFGDLRNLRRESGGPSRLRVTKPPALQIIPCGS